MLMKFVEDGFLWLAAWATAMAVMGMHYLVARYDLWCKGMALIGRYVVGVLSFLVPFAVWCLVRGEEGALIVLVILVATAGVTTLLLYLIDRSHDYAVRGQDLKEAGFPDGQD